MLSEKYPHFRDKNIVFIEDREKGIHDYIVQGMEGKPISVTKLVHKYFPEFNQDEVIKKMMNSSKWSSSQYFGLDPETIKKQWENNGKEASELGTKMHRDIELYLNNVSVDTPPTKEFNMFLDFWKEFQANSPNMKPYRTEWLIYDEDIKLAGSVDFVLSNASGDVVILDWKRSKEIKGVNPYEKGFTPFKNLDSCNYVHYTLQLNFYAHILENKYGKKVVGMAIVVLHPSQDKYLYYPIQKIDLKYIWPTLTKNVTK